MSSETFLLDAFSVSARDIAEVDINSLLALSVGVGWSHRLQDWEFMLELGRGRVAMDEVGRVHGVAMWFPFGDRAATVGMVITTPRLQTLGGGQWLMRNILRETEGRALGLHATSQSHRLFLSLGFEDEGTVYQREGHVGAPAEPALAVDGKIRAFVHSDMSAIRDLDRAATGWVRDDLIDALIVRSRGSVLIRDGKMEACALMRSFGRGTVIGPIIARCEEDAFRVLQPLISELDGRFARIDLWDETGGLAAFAERCGLRVVQEVTRMSLGKPWPFSRDEGFCQFALASQATG